jgi:hypothetical protein
MAAVVNQGTFDADDGSGMVLQDQDPHNRFQSQLKRSFQNAAFGQVNVMDVVANATNGQEDLYKKLRLSIRQQYWDLTEVVVTNYWSATIGMMVGALTMAILVPEAAPDVTGEHADMLWGVFLLVAAIAAGVSTTQTHRHMRRCDKKKADDAFKGHECLSDWDCTEKDTVTKGVCSLPKPGWMVTHIRALLLPVMFVAGVALVAATYSASTYRLPRREMGQAVIYGLGIGNLVAVVFS